MCVILAPVLLDAATSTCRTECRDPEFTFLTLFFYSVPPESLTEMNVPHPHPLAKAK